MYFSGILGAILFIFIYHFSTLKKSSLCALLAALPFMGLFGLMNIYKNNANIRKYLLKIVLFYSLYILLFFTIHLIYEKTINFYLAIAIGLLLWFIMVCCNIKN